MPINSFDAYPMSWRPARATLAAGPLYLALAAALERDVRTGALPAETRLPPQRELADFLDVDFTTITRAYNVCRAKGLVYGVVGRGTFVADAGEGVANGKTKKDVIDLGVVQAFPEIGTKSVVAAARTVLARETATRKKISSPSSPASRAQSRPPFSRRSTPATRSPSIRSPTRTTSRSRVSPGRASCRSRTTKTA